MNGAPAECAVEAPPLLRATALCCGYSAEVAWPPLHLEVARGQLWALLGANGSGKSTLLRTLLGLLPAFAGEVWRPANSRQAYLGHVPPLAPGAGAGRVPLRVCDWIALGGLAGSGGLWGWSWPKTASSRARTAQLQALLQQLALAPLANAPLGVLSAGQRQRVEVARLLASQPDLVALDEPTSAMDEAYAQHTLTLLRAYAERRGTTFLVVGHQVAALSRVASHVLRLEGPQRPVQLAPSPAPSPAGKMAPAARGGAQAPATRQGGC